MFTGIIEETGTVQNIQISGNSGTIQIKASKVLEGTQIGDSIATDGICLTVTDIKKDSFTADIMAETVRRSSLSQKKAGSPVNLERAMPANGRFGGHIVSGHIDGTGLITQKQREENAVWITVSTAPEILKYIIEKGSITIDGISLTVAKVTNEYFQVSVIPHTASATTLIDKKKGDTVNLENDIIGKYIEKLMQKKDEPQKSGGLSLDYLLENGF